jgi:hypothetical protein
VIAFANSLAAEAEQLGAARGRAFAVTVGGNGDPTHGTLFLDPGELQALYIKRPEQDSNLRPTP